MPGVRESVVPWSVDSGLWTPNPGLVWGRTVAMAKDLSRRDVLGVAAVGVVGLAMPVAQAKAEVSVESVDKELAKPLSPEAKKLFEDALKEIDKSSKERLKTKLPENSEPCFTYFPSTREVRSK